MEQYGYEIKHGKHIAFKKIDGQQRFTRAMRIGEDYTEERLKKRILEEVDMKGKRPKAPFKTLDNVIDISANNKAKSSPGYKYWATKHNLSTMADTINQVRNKGFKTREQLEKAIQEEANEGQIVVALLEDGTTTLKRLYLDQGKKCVRLKPENKNMKDIVTANCSIQGIAVKIMKDLV